MKKFIIIVLLLVATLPILAQKKGFVLFGNAPTDLFINADKSIKATGTFLWSLDAVVSGAQITFNKEESFFETSFLSGVGGAVGYKHYKPLADGTPISDWGVSGAVLTKVKLNEVVETNIEVAILANVYNITAGPVYIFGENKLGLLVGANINF